MKALLLLMFCITAVQDIHLYYEEARLEEVLIDLESKYQVHFSYSIDRIDIDRIISSQIKATNIHDALHELLKSEQIVYKKVGNQYVLKRMKPSKKVNSSKYHKKIVEKSDIQEQFKPIEKRADFEAIIPIASMQVDYFKYEAIEVELLKLDTTVSYPKYVASGQTVFLDPNIDLDMGGIKLGIISGIDSDGLISDDAEKNVSINLLWGETQALNGFELGTFYNTILAEAKGIQVSGIGNQINGDLEGVQIGGIINQVKGNTQGVQIGGLINSIGGEAKGAQVAGLVNINEQSDGLVQISGIGNKSFGKAYTQISGIYNQGDEVDVQVSGIFNKATHVRKLQIGLVNVADTVDGLSIGIVNLVKKGYNRAEFFYDETLYLNGAFRLGTSHFHSIFKVGYSRFDSDYYRWGVGFGFGSRFDFSDRSGLNLDLTATHINENDNWENRLNLVNTLALTFSHRVFGKSELFIGPSFNVYVSERANFEGKHYLQNHFLNDYWGTVYDDYDGVNDGNTNDIIMWVGIKAGMRF